MPNLTLRVDRRLARKLLKHLRRARKPVTRLSHGAVEHELVDLEVPHRVGLRLRLNQFVLGRVTMSTCGRYSTFASREASGTGMQNLHSSAF